MVVGVGFGLGCMCMQGVNVEAAKSGDRRLALEVLRDTLAEQLDTTSASIHAQLAGQYRAVLSELAELQSAGKVTLDDALAERRARRKRGAVGSVRTSGQA